MRERSDVGRDTGRARGDERKREMVVVEKSIVYF
jgi:hypothetical protein